MISVVVAPFGGLDNTGGLTIVRSPGYLGVITMKHLELVLLVKYLKCCVA